MKVIKVNNNTDVIINGNDSKNHELITTSLRHHYHIITTLLPHHYVITIGNDSKNHEIITTSNVKGKRH